MWTIAPSDDDRHAGRAQPADIAAGEGAEAVLGCANVKPRTKIACQASGLKNQVPATGQVGSVSRNASTTT